MSGMHPEWVSDTLRDALWELLEQAERMAYGPVFEAAGIVWPGGEKPGEGVCQAKAFVQAKRLLGVPTDQRLLKDDA